MQIKKEPFELVIHIDEAGTRATASYRTRVFDDAGLVIDGATQMESVTLADLSTAFPWKDFIDAATQALLVNDEVMKEELATATAALKTAQDELATLKVVTI